MEALKRIRANTIETRLLNARGLPNFNIRFFIPPTLEPLVAGNPVD